MSFRGKSIGLTLASAAKRAGEEYGEASQVALEKIRINPKQPRRFFDEDALHELSEAIRKDGVLQPILLRPIAEQGFYEIVFGERRFRAAQMAGLTEISATFKELNDREAARISLEENLRREDLNPFEQASFKLRFVASELNKSEEQLIEELPRLHRLVNKGRGNEEAQTIAALEGIFQDLGGSWRTFAVHGIRVLKLPPHIVEPLKCGHLEYSKALQIVAAPEEHHASLLQIASEVSVNELAEKIRQLSSKPAAPASLGRLKKFATARRYKALSVERQKHVDELISELEKAFEE